MIDLQLAELFGMARAYVSPRGSRRPMNKEAKRLKMDAFSPEFSAYWQAGPDEAGERHDAVAGSGSEPLSASQQVALEELVERVSAARSVV